MDNLHKELMAARRRFLNQSTALQEAIKSRDYAAKNQMQALHVTLVNRIPRLELAASITAALIKELEIATGGLPLDSGVKGKR